MNAACKHLLGEQDFSSFRSTNCQSRTAVRNIYSAIDDMDNFKKYKAIAEEIESKID